MAAASGSQQATQTLEFTPEQDQVIRSLARNMSIVSALLLLMALLRAVTAVLDFTRGSVGSGLLSLVEAGLAALLGLILMTGANDARYIVDTQGHDKAHLMNAVLSLTTFLKVLLNLGILLAIVLVFRLF
jgi:hypothetical protein